MTGLVIFVCAILFSNFFDSYAIRNSRNGVIYTVKKPRSNSSLCDGETAKMWSYDFHNCFIDRKYKDGGRDLNNIVDRILDHSKDCIKNSTKDCRPDFDGFMVIMEKVIDQMKEYCFIYLEHIIKDRDKVKDLQCVESSLSKATYRNCFRSALDRNDTPQPKFEKDVEKSISCSNKGNKRCSKAAKTDLNTLVRYVLRVRQPETEDIEEDPKPTEPPKRWYDYIFQPFISLWKTVKSWFGF